MIIGVRILYDLAGLIFRIMKAEPGLRIDDR